jgi:predicted TIM-barrel fold metal-dependent hydrolase
MVTINAHVHLIDVETVMGANGDAFVDYIKGIAAFGDLDRVIPMLTQEEVLRQMDAAGIERSILFALYCPLLYASNEFVRDACSRHPDRFWGFASVDPHDEAAPDVLERAVREYGLKGVKLHPPMQNFYPNDRKLWPIYAKADELGIPVVFHVGTTPFGHMVRLDQAYPILIDEIANDFPTLRIMLTHLGTLWHHESFMLVEKHPQVYIDTASYPYEMIELMTPNLVERIGPDKLIFGTDFPMPYQGRLHRMADFTETLDGLDLTDAIKTNIRGPNLLNMLGLSPSGDTVA